LLFEVTVAEKTGYAKTEIKCLLDKSEKILKSSKMHNNYCEALREFSRKILKV